MAKPRLRKPVISVQPSIDLDKMADKITSFPAYLFPYVKENVEETFGILKDLMAKRSSEGPLYRRTGRLKRSWGSVPEGYNLRSYAVKTGSFASYSVKHERGGYYEPQRPATFFWIPVGPNIKLKNRAAKFSPRQARDFIDQGKWRYAGQKKDPGTPQGEPRKKALILNENDVPVYVLVSRIYLPPRLGFQDLAAIFVRRVTTRLHTLSAKIVAKQLSGIPGWKA